MNIRSIGLKILLVVGLAASIGMTFSLYAYSIAQEKAMHSYNEQSMAQTVEAVIESMRDIMLVGDANLAPAISTGLKSVKGAQDFRILRIDGTEAFQDNRTMAPRTDKLINNCTDICCWLRHNDCPGLVFALRHRFNSITKLFTLFLRDAYPLCQ